VRLPKAKIDDLEKKFIAKSALKGGDLNPKKLHLILKNLILLYLIDRFVIC